jgi:hypothetical protein
VNFRERYVLIGVCALVAAILGYAAFRSVSGMFTRRSADIAKLEKEVSDAKKQAQLGERAKKKIAEYEARSLPSDPAVARREYQNWLLTEVEKAGFVEPKIDADSPVKQGELFERQPFTINAKGGLPQIVQFLHAFYSQDWLHRITRMSLQPVKDSKLMLLSLSVDTLSLAKAKDTQELVPRPSKRLQLADSKAYYDTIVGRNLFGPPNNPPRVSVSGVKDVYLGRTADLTVRASDADPLDKFSYELIESDARTAQLDPVTGKFSWRPSEPGKYEFIVEASDDGYPTKAVREKIVINVSEQRDTGPSRDRFEGFDKSKFTVLTAVFDIEGQGGEIRLHNRPDGQFVVLHTGDQFEIGSVKGKVAEIGEYDFSFDREGKRLKLALGETLFNARVVGDTPSASQQPTVETSTTVPPESRSPPAEDAKPGEDALPAEAADSARAG